VVAMQRLAIRCRLLWIKASRIRDDLATDCEAALLPGGEKNAIQGQPRAVIQEVDTA